MIRRVHLLLSFGLVALIVAATTQAAVTERIPPPPSRHFNDYAGVVSPAVVAELDGRLENFERAASSQLVVAIFPRMESESSVADYTVRVAEAWKVGGSKVDNGAVLFAFMAQRELYLQVGYGLEAVLPDALAKRIIETEIIPRFRAGDVDGGMRAAVNAMIAAAQGEYRGTGKTANDARGVAPGSWGLLAFILLVVVLRAFSSSRSRRAYVFGGPRGGWWLGPPGGGGGNRGGWSGGGGGGGFTGGGGSFGGGGAGGKW